MQDNLKIGIASFAHVHAPAYAKDLLEIEKANFAGIYDRNQHRGSRAASSFDTRYYKDYEPFLRDMDAIVVTSENTRHKKMIKKAAPKLEAILCEKPLATNLKDANQIKMACKKHNTKLYTAFPMRHSPPVKSLKETFNDGKIGALQGISGTNQGTLPPGWFQDEEMAGGGALIDHTVHLLDIFRWAFDLELKTVYTRAGTLMHDIEVEDSGLTTLQFSRGVFGTIDSSWSRPETFPTWGNFRLRVYGTEGIINLDAFNQKFTHYDDRKEEIHWKYWGTDNDREMLVDFLNAALRNEKKGILATGEDGRKTVEVVQAIYESVQLGEPVDLN